MPGGSGLGIEANLDPAELHRGQENLAVLHRRHEPVERKAGRAVPEGIVGTDFARCGGPGLPQECGEDQRGGGIEFVLH